jgi:hypothetical protein
MLIAKVIKVNLSDLISSSLSGDLLYQSNPNLVSSNGSWKTSQVKSSRSRSQVKSKPQGRELPKVSKTYKDRNVGF